MLSARRILRTVFFAGLFLSIGAFASPAFVSTDGTYTMTYTGSDFQADAIHDSAYFWSDLGDMSQDAVKAAKEDGQTTVSERYQYVAVPEDKQFSVIRDEAVYQYRIDHTYDNEWLDFRDEAMAAGGVLMVLVVIVGNLRHYR
ncbi:hypothetical protein [Haladaptatus sp. DJG-WS-42]|uniref:hypothetical protein n=1 Tax=Haladaptatus sp. DJG-WS-42 TaxID=3120516 RepID=UPI0030CF2644